ncbi:MAG: DAK2 domain-containing protein [Acidimicrobiales bacterium]
MATLTSLDQGGLRLAMVGFRDLLRLNRERLNRLNVYPVPDGDTGTNMTLTLDSVVAELESAPLGLPETCEAISRGSLMGARGNSGIIVSQILRGLCESLARSPQAILAGEPGVDGPALALALRAASDAAYRAVMTPVEGTILTVVRAAADSASEAAAEGATLTGVVERSRLGAGRALARTPELLPVLAQAGVVDSGGSGLVLLLDALSAVISGTEVLAAGTLDGWVAGSEAAAAAGPFVPSQGADSHSEATTGSGGEGSGPRFEVMYLLDAPDQRIDELKATWSTLGDSIVVVGGGGLWNCHVHTDEIGPAIEAGIAIGRPSRIRVEDLAGQVAEEAWVREHMASGAHSRTGDGRTGDSRTGDGRTGDSHGDVAGFHASRLPTVVADRPLPPAMGEVSRIACAVVAVAAGDAVGPALRDLGVSVVVTGGQTMNPSTREILAAVESTGAPGVIILPNNRNVVGTAEAVPALASIDVGVVPTRTLVEALAALLVFDPGAGAEENHRSMTAAARSVVAGEVLRAVRAANLDAGAVRAGDYLGFKGGDVKVVDADLAEATCRLAEELLDPGHGLLTVVTGSGSTAEATAALESWLERVHPGVEMEVHAWGFPHAAYVLGAE